MDLFIKGQKITLFFEREAYMVEMTCTLEKVFDDRLDLALPPYFMRYIEFLQVGKTLTAKAFSKFGTVDFNTVVISSPMEENFSIELDYNSVKLTPGKDIPVISAMEKLEIIKNEQSLVLKAFEISTEQIKFYSDTKFTKDEIFEASLILPSDYGIINFKAIISDIDPVYTKEYTAQYMTMTETDRQTLLYYMYMYTKNSD